MFCEIKTNTLHTTFLLHQEPQLRKHLCQGVPSPGAFHQLLAICHLPTEGSPSSRPQSGLPSNSAGAHAPGTGTASGIAYSWWEDRCRNTSGTIFYLPLEVTASSREGKSGKITPARISHLTQASLSIPGNREQPCHNHRTAASVWAGSATPDCCLLWRGAKPQRLLGGGSYFTAGKNKAGVIPVPQAYTISHTSTWEPELKSSGQGASGRFSTHALSVCQSICCSSDRSALNTVWTRLRPSEARSHAHRLYGFYWKMQLPHP